MEKWKRDALAEILQSWLELLESALVSRGGGGTVSSLARDLSRQRSSSELLEGIRHLQKAVAYCAANVSPGAICGYLCWALRR
jgi:hypothetical protein